MRDGKKAGVTICLGLLFLCMPLAAQEAAASDSSAPSAETSGGNGNATASQGTSVDELFATAQDDTETEAGDAHDLLNVFHAQPLTVSGSISATAGGVVGLSDGTTSSGEYTPVWDATPGLWIVPKLSFEARPDENSRVQGTVYFYSYNNFSPTISDLFFDYTLLDTFYFRIGKHTLGWGGSRYFDAGADLMSGSGSGINIKVSVPIGTGGMTAVLLSPASIGTWKTLTYGLQGDFPLYKSELILAGTCLPSDTTPLKATAIFKTSVGGFDVFAEGVAGSSFEVNGAGLTAFVSGFYWDHSEPNIKVIGEYYFNLADSSYTDHRVTLVVQSDKIFGSSLNFGMQWAHEFSDNSGVVVAGVTSDLWPHVSMQFGIPFRYGAPGSFYLVNMPPSIATTGTVTTTWYQRYGVIFRMSYSLSF
jgi:hypothetical protein